MKTFLIITVLLICINLGLCLNCYFGDQGNLGELKNSTNGQPLMSCSKNITTNLDVVQIERGGSATKHDEGCETHGHLKFCYCNTDGCNTADASARLLLPLIALPAFIMRFV